MLLLPHASVQAGDLTYIDQGLSWDKTSRTSYYTQDQGSRLINLQWIEALKTANGEPFLGDQLARYGFLTEQLKGGSRIVGATVVRGSFGFTCSACHTREISVDSHAYRIDGAPALIDLQAFVLDLDAEVQKTLNDPVTFNAFSSKVLGITASQKSRNFLMSQLSRWASRYHLITSRSFPPGFQPNAGLGRIDALGLVFNRVAGLDIGSSPSHEIAGNIVAADAPSRYPFLWNVGRQDFTQWPGSSQNGNEWLALQRNQSEVMGVFADYSVTKSSGRIKFGATNSTNYFGLIKQERLVAKMGPPRWPWSVDNKLAEDGQKIFQAQCADCHGIQTGQWRSPLSMSWKTPVLDVGTDSRVHTHALSRSVDPGVLAGTYYPEMGISLPATGDVPIGVLLNVITQQAVIKNPLINRLIKEVSPFNLSGSSSGRIPHKGDGLPSFSYESKVLQGIWSAAPYLHNGSVPTLQDLLKPDYARPKSFKVGKEYDINKVGMASEQSGRWSLFEATGCDARDSGNSNCGHNFGTELSDAKKRALLEYMKTL